VGGFLGLVHSRVDHDGDAEGVEQSACVRGGLGGGSVLEAVEEVGELVEVDAVAALGVHVWAPARNLLPLLPSTT
jgi:hypothetical protein